MIEQEPKIMYLYQRLPKYPIYFYRISAPDSNMMFIEQEVPKTCVKTLRRKRTPFGTLRGRAIQDSRGWRGRENGRMENSKGATEVVWNVGMEWKNLGGRNFPSLILGTNVVEPGG